MKSIFKSKTILIAIAAIMLMMLAACDTGASSETPAESSPDLVAENVYDIGQGATVFRLEVTDDEETLNAWNVHTDETTVGAALLAVGLIDGDVSDYGLFVTEVNGLEADFNANQAWWAFYIDGEMAMAGVDATDIEQGKVYAFIYTIG